MSTIAHKLLEDFKSLSPDEQLIVRDQLVRLTEETQKQALLRLRGASEGKDLLSKLLIDRAGERARD